MFSSLFSSISLMDRVLGMVTAILFFMAIHMVKPGAFGGGDVKLAGVMGLIVGPTMMVVLLFAAIFAAGIYIVILWGMKKKGEKQEIAFGPFLCIGFLVVVWYGEVLWRWYFS